MQQDFGNVTEENVVSCTYCMGNKIHVIFLEAHPNIGLNVFHQVSQVDGTVRVREGRSNEDATWIHDSALVFRK